MFRIFAKVKEKQTISRREWLGRIVSATAASVAGGVVMASCGKEDGTSDGVAKASAGGVVASVAQKIRCVNCGHCMPCEFGVDIPGVFLFYNRAIEEGFLPSEDAEPTRAEARRFLSEYDKALDDKVQAHRCISCYHCAGNCPQNIFIARQMDKITELTEKLRNRLCQDD